MSQYTEPVIQLTVMRVLVALYESGIVQEVNLGNLMRLFVAEIDVELESEVMSFNDPDWVSSYNAFKGMQVPGSNDKVFH